MFRAVLLYTIYANEGSHASANVNVYGGTYGGVEPVQAGKRAGAAYLMPSTTLCG